ncbi:MAG: response regulator [Alphaproteobacteria bacterium]|nr:MAG: response regulator [Alphaproteobacteria bacterium]
MSVEKKAVAVVDDDEAVLDATSCFLQALGYDTRPFSSGEAFLASGVEGEVFCLLTDINMPGLSGLELQDRVRLSRPALPIVMMTARAPRSLPRPRPRSPPRLRIGRRTGTGRSGASACISAAIESTHRPPSPPDRASCRARLRRPVRARSPLRGGRPYEGCRRLPGIIAWGEHP